MNLICGIDPGITGAVAFYYTSEPTRIMVEDIPVVGGTIAGGIFHELLTRMKPDMAIVESVASRPGQGVSSVFTFGRSFGTIIGCVQSAGIQLHFASPTKWKKHFNLNSDKEASRELALRMFPQTASHFARKKDHNRSEAALLALYAAQVIAKDKVAA